MSPTPLPDLPPEGLPLGGCRLFTHIGRGAMGQVWQGLHGATGVPVAVKVMTDAPANNHTFARAFRNEVEAVARLHHPGIVHIYDCGEVSAEDSRASEGIIAESSPFLVMELVVGGKLDRSEDPLPWPVLKGVLVQLLDALAHAHARGVIHRDLKPANVLTTLAAGDAIPAVKLTDFGLAHALDDHAERFPEDDVLATSGTPPYMAPEQFQGDWRSQGPWTDLYALGCLAFALAAGEPPFRANDVRVMAYHHMIVPPPALEPRMAVPSNFAAWLHTLLAKRPEHRFARAADARLALLSLNDQTLVPPSPTSRRSQMAEASTDPASHTAPVETTILPSNVPPPSRPPVSLTWLDRRPPILSADWRRDTESQASMVMRAGIKLFGLREPPLVAREAERDAVWAALREVHQHRDARAIVLRGAAGTGKSRLARWMAERADELGAAIVLSASHSARGGTHDGVLAMLRRHLRAGDLDRDALSVRLGAVLTQLGEPDTYLREALLELLQPGASGTELLEGVGAKAEEREWLVLRVLCLLAIDRPLILLIDDAQWGLDALRLIHRLLSERGLAIPALAILTVRDDTLAERPLEQAVLAELLNQPRAKSLEIGQLDDGDQRVLIAHLLGLTDDLVNRVAERTSGNPLFAVQLVGDWVARGLLEPGPDGLVLRVDEPGTLPSDIDALCRGRLDQALADRHVDDALSLELAALLGAEFDESEWSDACRLASLQPSRTLLPDLGRQGLLELGFSNWRFAHGVIRDNIETTARAHGRFAARHLAIARMLKARHPGRPRPEVLIRIGRHLRDADALHEAHPPLLSAARALRIEADHERAIDLLRERAEVLDRLGIPSADPLRAEGDLTLAQLHLDRGERGRGREIAEAVAAAADAKGWPALKARALLRLGDAATADDNWELARTLHGEALAALVAFGDRRGEFEARQGVAEALYYMGEIEASAAAYAENRALAEALGDELALAETLWGLGYVRLWRGDREQARTHFEGMRDILTRRGASYRLCEAYNSLGEVARLAGNYHEAEQWYWACVRLAEAFGTARRLISRVNIGLSLLARGERDAALALAEQVVAEARPARQRRALLAALSLLASIHSVRGNWNRCAAALTEVETLVGETGYRDGDVAAMCLSVGEAAAEAGEHEVGARAAGLARAIWPVLDRRGG